MDWDRMKPVGDFSWMESCALSCFQCFDTARLVTDRTSGL